MLAEGLEREPPLLVVNDGKGGHQRALPLNPVVEEALHAYGLPARGFVFRNANGHPMRAETLGTYVGRYLHGLALRASAHQLRHTFGTAVYAAERDLRMTQELLGHRNPSTTAVYAAFSPTDAARVVRALGVASLG